MHIASRSEHQRPESLLDAERAASFERLAERARRPAYARGLLALDEQLRTALGLGLDEVVRALGVGPWQPRHADGSALMAALTVELGGLWRQAFAVTPPVLVAAASDLIAIEYALPPGLAPLPEYRDDRSFRGLVLDFEQLSTAAYRYAAALAHQLVLAVAGQAAAGAAAPSVGGQRVDPAVASVWLANLTELYFPAADLPALFEGQPIRVFERELAAWVRQRGWGSS